MDERIQKIISNAGYCSRRKAEEFIQEGRVQVDGNVATIGQKASPDAEIKVDNIIIARSKKIYLMLNKPSGYTCTLSDPFEKKTIAKLIPIPERVYPIGRLDKNARGIILLTNDGNFANKLMHPRYEVQKTYHVELDKEYDTKYSEHVRKGITLKDGVVTGNITKLGKERVQIVIHEGRKHIVKRLFMKLGYYVKDLLRVAIGPVELDVKPGQTRSLKKEEVEKLMQAAKNVSGSKQHTPSSPKEIRKKRR